MVAQNLQFFALLNRLLPKYTCRPTQELKKQTLRSPLFGDSSSYNTNRKALTAQVVDHYSHESTGLAGGVLPISAGSCNHRVFTRRQVGSSTFLISF